MLIKEFISKSLQETDEIAKQVIELVPLNSIVCLNGDLGAGKTTFTKSFAKYLRIKDIITSPTFTILNEYETEDLKLYHFDMYRIETEEELAELGFDDIFNFQTDENCYILVEWSSKTPNLVNKPKYSLNIEKIDENTRKFSLYKD